MITSQTKITGLFGYPIKHSLSPKMHNAGFAQLNLDYCYLPFLVKPEDLKDAVNGIRAMGFAGVNLTIPHKEMVIKLLDETDKEAQFIGAVNTIVNMNGHLKGYNTDGRGFIKSLEEQGINLSDKTVLVIGAGGASKGICYYLAQKVKKLIIYNRSIDRRDALIESLCNLNPVFPCYELSDADSCDIIINTTPLGLKSDDPLPIDSKYIRKNHIVCDLIFSDTNLLQAARQARAKTISGHGMLLWQGIYAFELWTGVKAPVDIMREAVYNSRQ
ncbi:MAG: shikimate dehydrogenase [Nitrospirae bacterium]|nr:shikimate dehydrogenase [Nitrospirota bacterium]MBF0541377.1 shikimate dehydrogenase [Nitrospirota bacterium]